MLTSIEFFVNNSLRYTTPDPYIKKTIIEVTLYYLCGILSE